MKKKLFLLLLILVPFKTYAFSIYSNWNNKSSILPNAVVGENYSYKFECYGKGVNDYNTSYNEYSSPTTFFYRLEAGNEENIPEGLSLSEDGTLSGIPTKAGKYAFRITALKDVGSINYGTIMYEMLRVYDIFEITVNESKIDTSSKITVNKEEVYSASDVSNINIENYSTTSLVNINNAFQTTTPLINHENSTMFINSSTMNYNEVTNKSAFIYNEGTAYIYDSGFYYGSGDKAAIYNSGKLYLNNVRMLNNTNGGAIYNDGKIYVNGSLFLMNTNNDDDAIYMGKNSELYLDLTNKDTTINNFYKIKGDYNQNIYVILDETLTTEYEYTLFSNFQSKYKVNKKAEIKELPYIYINDKMLKIGNTLNYGIYTIELINDTTNKQLKLKVTPNIKNVTVGNVPNDTVSTDNITTDNNTTTDTNNNYTLIFILVTIILITIISTSLIIYNKKKKNSK